MFGNDLIFSRAVMSLLLEFRAHLHLDRILLGKVKRMKNGVVFWRLLLS
mgnify:CR=1 FL=1